MPIEGKKLYRVYLDEENAELLRKFLPSRRGQGGLSAIVDIMVEDLADTLRESGVDGPGKVGLAQLREMVLARGDKEG